MIHFVRLILVLASISSCAILTVAVSKSAQETGPIIVDGENNETAKAELDLLAQKADRDKLIILIARLGKGETSRKLNQRRLRTVSDYLKFVRAVSPDRLVTAEGQRMADVGRVEAYLDGRLFMVFTLRHNKNFAAEP